MTPKEKWKRLANPKCARDYGLSITEKELSTFKEGKLILKAIKGVRESGEFIESMGSELGKAMAKRLDMEIINVLRKM